MMPTAIAGFLAIAGVTVREAMRQRLWLLIAALAVVLAVVLSSVSAVDQSAKLKLTIVVVTTVIGFAATLLAILVGSSQVRRDLDARIAIMLFSKPMPRVAYILGRWAGVQVVVAAALAVLTLVGSALIALRFSGLPEMRSVVPPSLWQVVSATGEVIPATEGRSMVLLSGPPGNAARCTFSGLPTPGEHGLDVLLRADLRSLEADEVKHASVTVLAAPALDAPWQVLALDPHSPYGTGDASEHAAQGQVLLRGRNTAHQDLSQDYCRLRLPKSCVSKGQAIVQLVRLDSRTGILFERNSGAYVGVDGGGFIENLGRAALVVLAASAVLTAATLAISGLSSLPVALLGGLTLFFCGNALHAVRDALEFEELSLPVHRLLSLAQDIFPDFDRFPLAARLAAAEAIDWGTVAQAFTYFGIFTLVFLALAWLTIARKDV
ncbi:MAG: hypothetical protein H0V44_14230 [Planctomycetes bacterium]|nr:hypothetical protein [Planctomycetota bacterium]